MIQDETGGGGTGGKPPVKKKQIDDKNFDICKRGSEKLLFRGA